MNSIRKIPAILVLLAVGLSACGAATSEGTQAPSDIDAILTAGVGTLAASIFETQTALVPPVTETSAVTLTSTNTALPLPPSPATSPTQGFIFVPAAGTSSLSPTPTGTFYTPTVNPLTLATGCNNLLLLRDETIPAGTVMKPGESFTKTWKVANNGTCNWALQYRLAFVGGNQMGGEASGLGKVIEPNKWTQLSIGLTAPKQPGTYTGTWRLGDQAGKVFGSSLTVSIAVALPTNTPAPTLTATPVTPSNTPTDTPVPSDTPIPSDTPTP